MNNALLLADYDRTLSQGVVDWIFILLFLVLFFFALGYAVVLFFKLIDQFQRLRDKKNKTQ